MKQISTKEATKKTQAIGIRSMMMLAFGFLFSTQSTNAQTVTIGTGTASAVTTATPSNSSTQSPFNTAQNFGYVQTIYLQSEINASGTISAIKYYYTGTNLANSNWLKIYMRNSPKTTFATLSNWEAVTDMTLVYNDTLPNITTPGWVNIPLTTPFPYDNSANLVVAVDENKPGNDGTSGFQTTTLPTSPNFRTLFVGSGTGTSNYDPTTTSTAANGRNNIIGNIQIVGLTVATCQVSAAPVVGNTTTTTSSVTWTAPTGASGNTQYDWEIRTGGAAGSGNTGLIQSNTTATAYANITSLSPGTSYLFYERTNCGGGSTSVWTLPVAINTPPANDNPENAITLNVSPDLNCDTTISASTLAATASTVPAPAGTIGIGSNHDIWYTFNTNDHMGYQFAFNNVTPIGVTVAIYQGTPGNLNYITAQSGSTASALLNITGLNPFSTYYARIYNTSGSATAFATFNFCVKTLPDAPFNDSPNGAMNLFVNPDTTCDITIDGSTFSATQSTEGGTQTCIYGQATNDDVWYQFIPTSQAVQFKFSNVSTNNDAMAVTLYTGLPNNLTAVPGACYSGQNISFAGLTPGTPYYARVYTIGETNLTFATFTMCLSEAPGVPVNDTCANASNLTVNPAFATNAAIGNLFQATSEGTPIPSCQTNIQPGDVWYTATVPASGNMIVQTSAFNQSIKDLVMVAYTGTCSNLTPIMCDDDGNPETLPSANHSRITLTNQTPGTVVHYRVLAKGNDITNVGPFTITAWDQSVNLAIAPGGACTPSQQVEIKANYGNLYRWVPIYDVSGNIVAEIYPNGNELGKIITSVYKNTGAIRQSANGIKYLDRNVTITPEVQPSTTAPVKVRLYLLSTELAALQSVDPSVINVTSLNVSRNEDYCQSAVGSNTQLLLQTGNSNYSNGFYVQFNTTSFSSFYLNGGNTPLPVELISFTGRNSGSGNILNWKTASEKNFSHFEIEHATDGMNYEKIGRVMANTSESNYTYTDFNPAEGKNFYRLNMVDQDQKSVYSNIVLLDRSMGKSFAVKLFPNPADQLLTIAIEGKIEGKASITIVDILGKIVERQFIDSNLSTIDISKLESGIYFIQYKDNNNSSISKIVKK